MVEVYAIGARSLPLEIGGLEPVRILDIQLQDLSVTEQAYMHGAFLPAIPCRLGQGGSAVDLFAVETGDDITFFDTCFRGSRLAIYVKNFDALAVLGILRADAQFAAIAGVQLPGAGGHELLKIEIIVLAIRALK